MSSLSPGVRSFSFGGFSMIESGTLDKRQGSDREEKVGTQLNSHLLDTWTSTRSSILNVSSSSFGQHILFSFP